MNAPSRAAHARNATALLADRLPSDGETNAAGSLTWQAQQARQDVVAAAANYHAAAVTSSSAPSHAAAGGDDDAKPMLYGTEHDHMNPITELIKTYYRTGNISAAARAAQMPCSSARTTLVRLGIYRPKHRPITTDQLAALRELASTNLSHRDIAETIGMSPSSVLRYLDTLDIRRPPGHKRPR